jgi:hypothetical protein
MYPSKCKFFAAWQLWEVFFIPILVLWIWQIFDAAMSVNYGTSRKITIIAIVLIVLTGIISFIYVTSLPPPSEPVVQKMIDSSVITKNPTVVKNY